ncbi:MAG: molybdopterin-dependent oxidoreductase [Chloroflexota bacterium]
MSQPVLSPINRRSFIASLLVAGAACGLGSTGALVAPTRADDGELHPSTRQPGELSPLVVQAGAFYRVTKNAAGDPAIAPDQWRMAVDGEVERPVQLDYATLLQLPSIEIGKTLECISNLTSQCGLAPFGCDLIGNALWRGAVLSDVLQLAGGVRSGATNLAIIGADEFSSAIPLQAALDPETILAFEMNGEPLPSGHGGPVRMLVPGRYGYKSAKWVVGVRPMSRSFLDWYGQRNWNRDGIVKTMSRIDVPVQNWTLPAGTQRIAGIAYAGDRGVSAVEFSADGGGTWQAARFLEPPVGRDAWVRWEGSFALASGQSVSLVSRAYDGAGRLQSQAFKLAEPDGGEGWHTVDVRGA